MSWKINNTHVFLHNADALDQYASQLFGIKQLADFILQCRLTDQSLHCKSLLSIVLLNGSIIYYSRRQRKYAD